MSSNVQTQINDLNAAVQALDSSLTQITGNTMSNYNQLSRIVSQQANIYNTVYYGSGNMSTGFLSVGANCNINGNLIIANGNANINGSLLSNGISTFSGQSPFKIDYGNIITDAAGDGTFNYNITYTSTPFVFLTVFSGSNFQKIAHIKSRTTTNCTIKSFDNGSPGAMNVMVLVIGV